MDAVAIYNIILREMLQGNGWDDSYGHFARYDTDVPGSDINYCRSLLEAVSKGQHLRLFGDTADGRYVLAAYE